MIHLRVNSRTSTSAPRRRDKTINSGGVFLRTVSRLVVAVLLTAPVAAAAQDDDEAFSSDPLGTVPSEARSLIGALRPEFTLPDLTGQPRSITDWNEDAVILNFWATWCPPCRDEMPLLQSRHAQFSDAGLTVIGVAIDDAKAVADFVAELELDFPIVIGQQDAFTVTRDYGNRLGALPYTVIIDRGGRILDAHRGIVDASLLDAWIEHHGLANTE
ncbi:MAG: TlpA family protein disulfide reductase [Thioalkalivibrionaceae bacterium]